MHMVPQLLDRLHQEVGPVFSSRWRSQQKYLLRSLISQKIPYFLSSRLLGIAFVLSAPCVAPLSMGLTHGNPMKYELAADGVGGRSATSGLITCRCGWIFCRWGVSLPSLISGCIVQREETHTLIDEIVVGVAI